MFSKSHSKFNIIYLLNVILVDSQYTMDIFCNAKLVGKIYQVRKNMYLMSNGGKMFITHKAYVTGYRSHIWFDQKNLPT